MSHDISLMACHAYKALAVPNTMMKEGSQNSLTSAGFDVCIKLWVTALTTMRKAVCLLSNITFHRSMDCNLHRCSFNTWQHFQFSISLHLISQATRHLLFFYNDLLFGCDDDSISEEGDISLPTNRNAPT